MSQMVRVRGSWSGALGQGAAILVLAAVLGMAVNLARTDAIPLVRPAEQQADELVIPLEQAKHMFDRGEAVFLDARVPDYYDMGHIEGALNVPVEDLDAHMPDIFMAADPDALFIAYCDGPHCELSHELAIKLMEQGFSNVRVLINGWTVWSQAGYPVTAGSGGS